jgi:hypothetical protein
MDCKLIAAQAFVDLFHFAERIAGGWPRRLERPCAFGATEALKARLFNPYHPADYGHLGTPRELWVRGYIYIVRSVLANQVETPKANRVNPLMTAAPNT